MMQYNMLDQRPAELLDLLYTNRVSILARGPFAKGMLSNQALDYITEKGKDGYLNYTRDELLLTVQNLRNLNVPLTKLSLQFVLHHPAVSSAVFGVSTLDQLNDNLKYAHITPLEAEFLKTIKQLTKPVFYTSHR